MRQIELVEHTSTYCSTTSLPCFRVLRRVSELQQLCQLLGSPSDRTHSFSQGETALTLLEIGTEERVEGPAARQMRPMHDDTRAPPLVAFAAGWFLQTELRMLQLHLRSN